MYLFAFWKINNYFVLLLILQNVSVIILLIIGKNGLLVLIIWISFVDWWFRTKITSLCNVLCSIVKLLVVFCPLVNVVIFI